MLAKAPFSVQYRGMFTDEEILRALGLYLAKHGQTETLSQLTKRGVGARTASGLVNGSYRHKPSVLLRTALTGLLKEELKTLKSA